MKATVIAAFGFVAAAAPAAGQSAMELNRAGQWAEAADVALRTATDLEAPLPARCEAYGQVAYAELRLGRTAEAAEHLAEFDRLCAEAMVGTWVETEASRLRAELGGRGGQVAAITVSSSPDDPWQVADDLAALGVDQAAVADHQRLCEQSAADACLIAYQGSLIQEWYGEGYREPMFAMSTTKSVTSLLAGLLVGDGRLELEDPVARFIPEWESGARAGVTVGHLLTMTSGLPDFPPGAQEVGSVDDKEAFAFALDLVTEPGRSWAYSNDGAFLLSPLLDRAAGEPIEDYAARRLFGPLGMANTRLHVYPEGQAWTHADMETTPRDLARIGQLMLQRGRWNGEQVVAEEWIDRSVRPSQNLNPAYGLMWWLNVPQGYAARGYLDTNLYVLPEHDLVVVRMQSRPQPDATSYEPSAFDILQRLVPR